MNKINWIIGTDDYIPTPDSQTQVRILVASEHSDHLVETHKLDINSLYFLYTLLYAGFFNS